MDLDAYVLAHAHEWQRLEELVGQKDLDGARSDELVERYSQVATHLSVVRTSAPDASLIAHLSSLLSRARNRAAGSRTGTWNGVRLFFVERTVRGTSNLFRGLKEGRAISRDRSWQPMAPLEA